MATTLLDEQQRAALETLISAAGFAAVLLGVEEIALEAADSRQGGNVSLVALARELRGPVVFAKLVDEAALRPFGRRPADG